MELHYKIADKRTAVVVHYHSELIESITLFSYLFGIQVMLAIVILLYRLFFSYFTGAIFRVRFLNLRRRVHFSMLAVIFVSFIIIGSVTILFFTVEYKSSNSNKLQSAMQVVKQSVQEYLKPENAFATDFIFDSVSRSTRFKYFITNIANSQKIDINIFDDRGTLFSSSQDEIYEKGLISRKIRPDAFFRLNNLGKSLVIQDESVAGLSYLSAYQPLRNEEGVTLGYLGVPFFSSERDLNFQISNIVVTLINLYAFIFLVSGIITVVITRWIVRTFNIITQQFELLNLEQNERLFWPYDDEIGKLVDEYNKMVQKVEANAVLLAKSERESAWREMARQVAHEIKNPLTPMKLNIQYLQQAVRNNSPNLKQLADRVSESMVEQIDNLSYIASEFSNFAKMPEARPEAIDLCMLLTSAAELYQNNEGVELALVLPNEHVLVVADKSQLLRVFTNLLENAKQAIPDGTPGRIRIAVEVAGDRATVKITDNGVGISRDAASKIFEPYFTTKSSGTGLGLAMTKKIIELWEGEIGFESEAGQGATFFVTLRKATGIGGSIS
jgi:two-component system, NtrC family, nitrogen regulation sensor histidine kinase NtrY